MRLAGWKSRTMLNRYAASAAEDRAREAHRHYPPTTGSSDSLAQEGPRRLVTLSCRTVT
jgi:hypothetical protein